MNVLVVAPHPDDEILGCGGAIARYAQEGHSVTVAIVTKADPPLFSVEMVKKGRQDALKAHKLLGVQETIFCDLPAAELDGLPHHQVNAKLGEVIKKVKPALVFVPFLGDIHLDHQHVFLSSLVAMRPNQWDYPAKIYAYETLSETNWNAPYITPGFHPNIFIDISQTLALKLKAFALHETQAKAFPHERSLKTIEALAALRGSAVHREAAEAFVLIREVI